MIALVLALLTAEPDEREHRIVAAPAILALVPFDGIRSLPLALEATFGVEIARAVRLISVTSLDSLDGGRFSTGGTRVTGFLGPFTLSGLEGLEGIITPLLPVEVGGGAAIGLSYFEVCGSDFCRFNFQARIQLRAFVGYRFNAWVSAALLASFNTLVNFPAPSWISSGAQLSVRF